MTTDELISHSAWLRSVSATLRQEASTLRRQVTQETAEPIVAEIEPVVVAPVPLSPHDVAMDALRDIRDILDIFSIEWQVAIVKALTARTLVMTHERTRPAPAVISA